VTEPATGTSLHGFACHVPWRVVGAVPDEVTGEFVMSREAPATVDLWPADAGVRVTYRVEPTALLVTAEVFSNDGSDLPFGLGFHPYFRVPGPFDQWLLQCDAAQAWPLSAMVPSGPPVAVPPDLDFRTARRLRDQHLDDVLTGLPEATGLQRRAALLSTASSLTVSSDPAFGDYVMFTPTSRDAVAIEPYTCATDAVNLQARGIDAGWRVLTGEQTATFTWRMDIA
jgi:aldose 1-epimerase